MTNPTPEVTIRTHMLLSNTLLFILALINTLWLVFLSAFLFRAHKTYKTLTAGIDKKDFAHVLKKIKSDLKLADTELADTKSILDQTKDNSRSHIQKIGFIRYNPFGNTGGDQSFCLCLLDADDNGLMITSLHARDQTRIYSKLIAQGKSSEKASLSKEEALCIKQALKGNLK